MTTKIDSLKLAGEAAVLVTVIDCALLGLENINPSLLKDFLKEDEATMLDLAIKALNQISDNLADRLDEVAV